MCYIFYCYVWVCVDWIVGIVNECFIGVSDGVVWLFWWDFYCEVWFYREFDCFRFDGLEYKCVSFNDWLSWVVDMVIVFWRMYGDCENYGVFNGYKGVVLDF